MQFPQQCGDCHQQFTVTIDTIFERSKVPLKRGVYGSYFHVSEAHLHRYLTEADVRDNHRVKLGFDDADRAEALLRGTKGRRSTSKHGAGHA